MASKKTLRSLFRILTWVALFVGALLIGFLSFRTYEAEEAPFVLKHPQEPVRLLFVGDMMFDRRIREITNLRGGDYLFSCADEVLQGYDTVIGNLEGPVTHNESKSFGSIVDSPENYTFTFPLETPKLLLRHNIRIVNLGNNHIYNFDQEGITETRTTLDKASVGYFGGVRGNGGVYRTTFKERPFSFVSFNEFGGEDATSTARSVAEEKALGNTVIVYAHWGDEYTDVPDRVRLWTNLFMDSGADAVIGSHPHVVQGWGVRSGKPYYYSLGNFIFDQYFSPDVMQGLAVEMVFKGSQISTKETRVHLERSGRSCIEPIQ